VVGWVMEAFGWVIAPLLGAPPAPIQPIWPREMVLRQCVWLLVGNVCEILGYAMVVYAVGKYVGWWVGSWRHFVWSQRRCLEPLQREIGLESRF
jgi:hypothetical protein